jgi:1-acyl-sn-glycerol-3-phosphate acyltransferase
MSDPVDSFDADRLDARDATRINALLPYARGLCQRYFSLRVEGAEHITGGAAIYVGNHNNGLAGPESLCTLTTLWEALGAHAPVYALAHDFAMRQFTPFGRALQPFGALRASQENGRRALADGASLLVYPGGDLEAYRHFRRRDEIVMGARTGFVRLARETGAPIVPVVAQGAHRSAVILSEGRRLAQIVGLKRWARLECFPVALTLPWGVAVGPWLPYLPLPRPIRLRFLAPLRVGARDDPASVRERIRAVMQSALGEMSQAPAGGAR